jgi:hypothetical protein
VKEVLHKKGVADFDSHESFNDEYLWECLQMEEPDGLVHAAANIKLLGQIIGARSS